MFFFTFQRVYVRTARQIKRIDSVKRSPIYNNFNETLNGLSSIRAYRQQERFVRRADLLLDENQRVWFMVFSSNRFSSFAGLLSRKTVEKSRNVKCCLRACKIVPFANLLQGLSRAPESFVFCEFDLFMFFFFLIKTFWNGVCMSVGEKMSV